MLKGTAEVRILHEADMLRFRVRESDSWRIALAAGNY